MGAGTIAAMVLCLFFIFWSILWMTGAQWGDPFKGWRGSFELLGFVSIGVLLVAGLTPVRSFRRQIDQIYGSPTERAATVARQTELAQADLIRINGQLNELRSRGSNRETGEFEERRAVLQIRRRELEDYVSALSGRTRGDWLMRPATVVMFAVAAAVIIGAMTIQDLLGLRITY
jgi:hypothetical protein